MKRGQYFNNQEESAKRGAEATRRRAAGRKPVEYKTECPVCGKRVRPPSRTLDEFPGTVRAANVSGICSTCSYATGKRRVRDKELSKEEAEARIERAKQEYAAMVADRRRRGIDPLGVQMPGEKPGALIMEDHRQLKRPKHHRPRRNPDECYRGHKMQLTPSSNRMRCYECERLRYRAKRDRKPLPRPTPLRDDKGRFVKGDEAA